MGRFEGLGSLDEMMQRAKADRTDGFVIYPDAGTTPPEALTALARDQVPMVLIDREFEDLDADSVTYDDWQCGHDIGVEMIRRGAAKVAVMPHRERKVSSVDRRLAGFRTAFKEAGRASEDVRFWTDVYADFSPSAPTSHGRHAAKARLGAALKREPVDGFFAINGDVAEKLASDLDTLQVAGPVPDKPTLIGACVHRPMPDLARFEFVATEERADALGEAAARLLLERMERRSAHEQFDPVRQQVPMLRLF